MCVISANGQSLEHILSKHYEAHNQEIWNMLRTMSANVEWHSDLGTFFGEFFAKKPDQVMIISEKSRFVEAYDGKEAWTQAYWTNGEITAMNFVRSIMLTELVTFGSPIEAHKDLKYNGRVEVDNVPCFWLEQEMEGRKVEYFIDRESDRLYKTQITIPSEEKPVVLVRTVSKYRIFNGIPIATVVTMKTSGLESEYVFDGIVLGEGIPSSKFRRPNG